MCWSNYCTVQRLVADLLRHSVRNQVVTAAGTQSRVSHEGDV